MSTTTIDRQTTQEVSSEASGTSLVDPASGRDPARRSGLWAALAAGTAIVALAAGAWVWQSAGMRLQETAPSAIPAEQLFVLEPQAVSAQLDISGSIAPGRSVAIVAPFDGVIREKRVQLGDHVGIGDVLVVMDTGEIASRFREAQSASLKAAMAADVLDRWVNGPEMLRARRSLEAAQTTLTSLERQVAELKQLLDRGIVSRNEYDGLVQQQASQRDTIASATDELNSTLARGNDENRQLATLELENTQSRLNDLKQQMAGAKVATAIAGILTRPPVNTANPNPVSIEPGATVTRGTALFAIADTSSFTVTGQVDEVDVNRVKIGQPVTISSDAFPGRSVVGRIVSVSAEADVSRSGAGVPTFEVRASFVSYEEALRRAIRIGMSARMTIETYANPSALVVPPPAVIQTPMGSEIRIRRGGAERSVPVLLGTAFTAGIEVVEGLSAGDTIVMP